MQSMVLQVRVGRVANDTTPKKFTVTKPWRKPTPTQGCSASEDDEEEKYNILIYSKIRMAAVPTM
jgi:hypothetical protein